MLLSARVACTVVAGAAGAAVAVAQEASSPSPGAEAAAGLVGPLVLVLVLAVLVWFMFCRSPFAKPSGSSGGAVSLTPVARTPSSAPSRAVAVGPRGILEAKDAGKNLVILFGSQTGTAEYYARRLSIESRKWGFKSVVADVCDIDPEEISELDRSCLLLFVMATYGEGEPTDNAVDFHEWLMEADGAGFDDVHFTVFGLGDTTYEHYQYMSRFVEEKLTALGATVAFGRGEGDDNDNLEEDFLTWQEAMWPALCDYAGLKPAEGADLERLYALVENTPEEVAAKDKRDADRRAKARLFDQKLPFHAPIVDKYELHGPKSDRSAIHVSLSLKGSRMRYAAGDHVGVLPCNPPELVEELAARLGEDLDRGLSLVATEVDSAVKQNPFPCPATLRTILSRYVDISSPVRKHLIKSLARYASDQAEQDRLNLLASNTSAEGKALYNSWIRNDERNILDLLNEFPSLSPPIDHVLEVLPALQPRYYSISSSSKAFPDEVHISAVVVGYETGAGSYRKGVATHWLSSLEPDDKVPMFIRKSTFRPPRYTHRPCIMVGPGTGLAPFRGFIQDRKADAESGKNVGPNILFFGCRGREVDFLYENELMEYTRSGDLEDLQLAFSREGAAKVYVQHRIKECGAKLWKLLSEDSAHFYVCGDAKVMAKDVQKALGEAVAEHSGLDSAEAAEWVTRFLKSERFAQDVW